MSEEPIVEPIASPKGDFKKLGRNSQAVVGELREFLATLKGKSPKEMMSGGGERTFSKPSRIDCRHVLPRFRPLVIPYYLNQGDGQAEAVGNRKSVPAGSSEVEPVSPSGNRRPNQPPFPIRSRPPSKKRQIFSRWVKSPIPIPTPSSPPETTCSTDWTISDQNQDMRSLLRETAFIGLLSFTLLSAVAWAYVWLDWLVLHQRSVYYQWSVFGSLAFWPLFGSFFLRWNRNIAPVGPLVLLLSLLAVSTLCFQRDGVKRTLGDPRGFRPKGASSSLSFSALGG